jgi:predicted nicotinamide N-methyase
MISRTVFRREFEISDFLITIEQDAEVGVGGTVWDAAMVLARFLALNQATIFRDVTRVLELGSGTGLCGIAVAMLKPEVEVVVTDQASHLDLIRKNVLLNSVTNVRVEELNWLNPSNLGHFDLIIGSDLVYDETLFAPLVETLSLSASSDSEIYLCSELRIATDLQFYKVAMTKGWCFTQLPQEMMDAEFSSPADIAIFKLSLN